MRPAPIDDGGSFLNPERRFIRGAHGKQHEGHATPLAYALLTLSSMEALPRDIIHSIREGLGMSRAEFARALGWAPSTISRWESGKAEPSRLSLKIILAYGEEHGVRYRARHAPSTPLLLPAEDESRALAIRPQHPESPEGAVSVLAMDAPPRPRSVSIGLGRPGWEAELHFRVAGRDRQPAERPHAGWVGPVTLIGASLCVLLAVGIPLMRNAPTAARRERPRPTAATRPIPPAASAHVARPSASDAPASVVSEPPLEARLEGVTLIGGKREATFRTPTDTLTLSEGERIGGQRATRIAGDGVELRDASGQVRTVGLGGTLPLD